MNNEKNETVKEFLNIQADAADRLGFWDERFKGTILKIIEGGFNREILKEYGISEIIPHGDKFLIHWYRRVMPLTDEQVKTIYGN